MFWRPTALAVVCGFGVAVLAGCGLTVAAKPVVNDLLQDVALAGARMQPEGAVKKESLTIAGVWIPVMLMPAPSRVTWPVRFTERVELDANLALTTDTSGVTLRIGLSDDRWYNEILRVRLDPVPTGSLPWQPIRVDLSAFSGWKWSLFYRPSRVAWKLIVNAEATPGGTIAWRQLAIQSHGLVLRSSRR